MQVSSVLAGVCLGVAVAAFGLTGGLSLQAGVEPLYAVLRGIFAFTAVLISARWVAALLDSLSTEKASAERPGESADPGE